jgi:hypothetical protein
VVHLEALDLLSKECESKVNLKAGSGLGFINNIHPVMIENKDFYHHNER